MYANPCMVSDRMRKTQYTSKIYHYHNHRHYHHHQHRIHSFGYFSVHFISHLNKLSIQSISGLPLFLLLLNFVGGHAMHCVNSVNWYFHCLTIRPYTLYSLYVAKPCITVCRRCLATYILPYVIIFSSSVVLNSCNFLQSTCFSCDDYFLILLQRCSVLLAGYT